MAALPNVDNAANLPATAASLLICLPSLPADALERMGAIIAAAFPGERVLIASPESISEKSTAQPSLIPYAHPRSGVAWTLAAGDYLAAADVALTANVDVVVLLGDQEISAPLLVANVNEVRDREADLVLPRYTTGPTDGLVTSALLYPLTRALFGIDTRFPLPLNATFSRRGAERLGSAAKRLAANGGTDSLLWPVAETAVAGFTVRQTDAGQRSLPQPAEADFNTLFTSVAGSLFADIEAKAVFWQRARNVASSTPIAPTTPNHEVEVNNEIAPMVENFRGAYANLQEIWSLVLPPQSLLALKRLAAMSPETFAITPQLWARIAYDFILAFHLRTINRGHLLGAFTSLYLAWVTSYLRSAGHSASASSRLIEETASAFELEKPYLLARWRWPDRFNP